MQEITGQIRQQVLRVCGGAGGHVSKRKRQPFAGFFFFNDTATTEIYTLSLHDALPISSACSPTLRSNSAIRPSDQRCFPFPGNTLPGPCRNSRRQRCNTLGFTSNARAASPIDTPCSSRRTAASLNSLVNCLRDSPMTQFSIQ